MKENGKNTKGIRDFLWAVQAQLDAVSSGRVVMFGNGRRSSFKFDKERIEISTEVLKKLPSTNTDANGTEHEGE